MLYTCLRQLRFIYKAEGGKERGKYLFDFTLEGWLLLKGFFLYLLLTMCLTTTSHPLYEIKRIWPWRQLNLLISSASEKKKNQRMPRFRQSQYSHGNQLTKNLDYSSSFCRKTTSAQKILVTGIQNAFFRVLAPQKA